MQIPSLSRILELTAGLSETTLLDDLRLGASLFRRGKSVTIEALRQAIAKDVRAYQVSLRGEDRLGAPAGAVSAVDRLVERAMNLVKDRARQQKRGINLSDLRALNAIMLETHADVHLPSDPSDRVEIQHRTKAMFPRGLSDIIRMASAVGIRDVEFSKADGGQKGMIKVAATDRNTWNRFEFFLDDANQRILCGDDFAEWAVKGDPRAEQMTNLLTALGRSSLKDVKGNNALDRVEFKPGDVDTYALLEKGYGRSCKRGRVQLIMQLAVLFAHHKIAFEETMSKEEADEVGEEKANEVRDKINAIVKNISNKYNIEDRRFKQMADLLAASHESRIGDEDTLVSVSKTEFGDLMKIADLEEKLSMKKLRNASLNERRAESELPSAIDRLSTHYKKKVPLGRVLLAMLQLKRNFVLWDAYETREAPEALPPRQEGRIAGQHRVNG